MKKICIITPIDGIKIDKKNRELVFKILALNCVLTVYHRKGLLTTDVRLECLNGISEFVSLFQEDVIGIVIDQAGHLI